MGPDVVSVRQNLNLLVDNGQVVPSANDPNSTQWGATLGGGLYVWRSGLGSHGGRRPGLRGWTGARHLGSGQHPGPRRGRAWHGAGHQHRLGQLQQLPAVDPGGPATPTNGTELLAGMTGTPGRYFEPWWARDFITMSAAVGP